MKTSTVEAELVPHLAHGEKVIWTARPASGHPFTPADLLLVPFSLFWAGFVFHWELRALGSAQFGPPPAGPFPAVWGMPFVLIGMYMTVGRFIYKAYRKRATVYVLTERRLLVLKTNFPRQIQSVLLSTLPSISMSVRRDGVGAITFGQRSGLDPFSSTGWPRTRSLLDWGPEPITALYDVPDASRVGALIDQLRGKVGDQTKERTAWTRHRLKRAGRVYEQPDGRSRVLTSVTGEIETRARDLVAGSDTHWYYRVTTSEGQSGYLRADDAE